MNNNVDKIKERVDIVELISSYLKVQKAGVNYKAACPFHHEKTPSFYVSPSRQIWHCFGCQKGGDQFAFVQEIEGVEFPEALRMLAERAGIELEKFDRSFNDSKTRLCQIIELAVKFFEKQLWESKTGQQARKYLRERGLRDETARSFRLGYAPDSWDSLNNFLQDRGFREQEMAGAGVVIKREGGRGTYDRFRSRVMFPIANLNGQAVGFAGRTFRPGADMATSAGTGLNVGHEEAKYVNTPQTLLYDKSRILYGLDRAKLGIRQKDRCLVVEGNMDVIMSHQAGATNVVASSGTALTDQHLKIIRRYTANLDLCFDQDAAGRNAMERGIALALRQNFNLGVVMLDDAECKDPADYVQKFGEKWRERSMTTRPIFSFYLENALSTFDATTGTGKKMIVEKVLPLLKSISNRVEQAHWIAELAMHLKVKDDLLWEQMNKMAVGSVLASPIKEKETFLATAKFSVLEDYLISLLLIRPELIKLVPTVVSESEAASSSLLFFLRLFKKYLDEAPPVKVMDYLVRYASESALSPMYLESLYLQAQGWGQEFAEDDLELEFAAILNQWWRRSIVAKLADLEFAVKQAEKSRNKEALARLMGQFRETADKLSQIKN